MHVCILGVGAIRGVIRSYLCRADTTETLIDSWEENVDRIKEAGLKVTAMEEDFIVRPRSLHMNETSKAHQAIDIAILAVKFYDTSIQPPISANVAPQL